MIYTIKTVVGRENIVIDSIASKVKTGQLNITALLHPEEIKGYVFVEGEVKDVEGSADGSSHTWFDKETCRDEPDTALLAAEDC